MTLEGARALLHQRIRMNHPGSPVEFSCTEATAILDLLNEWARAYAPTKGPYRTS